MKVQNILKNTFTLTASFLLTLFAITVLNNFVEIPSPIIISAIISGSFHAISYFSIAFGFGQITNVASVQIINFTGLTEKTVSFRKTVSALEFIMQNDNGIDFNTPKAAIYVLSPKNSKRLTFSESQNVIDLVEINTPMHERKIFLEGALKGIANADTRIVTFSQTVLQATMQIDLVNGHMGVARDLEDEMIVELTNLDANATYTINAIEEDAVTHDHIKYEILKTESEPNRVFNATGIDRFAIEISNAFKGVELRYPDGTNIKMTAEDIKQQERDSFGDVYVERDVIATGKYVVDIDLTPRRNYVIPVHGAKELQVNTDGTSLRVLVQRLEHDASNG